MNPKEPSPDSKLATVANLPALKECAARISTYHQSFERAAQDQLGYAFLCGYELLCAKERVESRHFMKWRETALPQIPQRTAGRYMQFAEAIHTQSKEIASLTAQQLLPTNGQLEEEDKKVILKAVHDYADGATLTELYRDLNILRKPKHQSERATGKPMTPAEKAAAEEQLVQDHIDSLIADLNLITPEFLGKAKTAARMELRDTLIEKSKLIKSLTPKRTKQKGQK